MKLNLANVKNKVSNMAGKTGIKIKQASPEILLVAGIGFMGAAVISGILAARHHDEIIDDHNERLDAAKADTILPEAADGEEIDESEAEVVPQKEINKKVRHVYCRTAANMVKLYAPTVAFMGLSAACFIGMHNIQAGRIAGFAGAYTGLKEYIEWYEKRNIELNGQENHEMCKYGWHEELVQDEHGKEKTVKVMNRAEDLKDSDECPFVEGLTKNNRYYIFSDYTSSEYKGNATLDLMTLRQAERNIRNMIATRGSAVVNDVLDELGMERTLEGMYEGWVDGAGPLADFNIESGLNKAFCEGRSGEDVWLEFNIHGNVHHMLKEKKRKEQETLKALRERRLKEDA